MRHRFLSFCISLNLLIACNNNKQQGDITITSEDGKTTAKAEPGNPVQSEEAIQKRKEELQKLSPYTLDQIKAFLPEELAGAKRSKLSVNGAMGTAYAEGEYEINDSTRMELKLFDCAGPAGVGIYNTQYLGTISLQSEDDKEYTKTIDLNGSKAIEQWRKDGSRATIVYMAADRLFVTLEGRNTGIDLLEKAAGNLRLK
ncbi:MAG: hypothetical protein ABI675_08055 [Chitinophagaceae bacterium]